MAETPSNAVSFCDIPRRVALSRPAGLRTVPLAVFTQKSGIYSNHMIKVPTFMHRYYLPARAI